MSVQERIRAIENAQQHGKGGDLGPGGHQGHNRGRSTLIHIGGPDLKGRGRNLEAKADQNHGHGERSKARRRALGKSGGDLSDIRASRCSKGQGNAVEKEGSRERAQQKVLEASLGALAGALANGREDVGRDGRDFQADENQQQLDRAGHQAHAHSAEEHQRVILGRPFLGAIEDVKGD